jgi:hypothetical protein
MESSQLILGVEQVRATDRTGLVRVIVDGQMLDASPAGIKATLLVDDDGRVHRFSPLQAPAANDEDHVSIAFAAPLELLGRGGGLSLELNGGEPVQLPEPVHRRGRATDAASSPAVSEPGVLAPADAARISELELALRQTRTAYEAEESARRDAERVAAEAGETLRRARADSEERIRTLENRCAELEATLADVLDELRVVAAGERGRPQHEATADPPEVDPPEPEPEPEADPPEPEPDADPPEPEPDSPEPEAEADSPEPERDDPDVDVPGGDDPDAATPEPDDWAADMPQSD